MMPVTASSTTGEVADVGTVPDCVGHLIVGVPATACALTVAWPLVAPL
ncbi:hypothetical protein [Bradyrhizobium diazoefficiens]|nr:hypothetical protein [Bradyrhizobium diazoefficiens]